MDFADIKRVVAIVGALGAVVVGVIHQIEIRSHKQVFVASTGSLTIQESNDHTPKSGISDIENNSPLTTTEEPVHDTSKNNSLDEIRKNLESPTLISTPPIKESPPLPEQNLIPVIDRSLVQNLILNKTSEARVTENLSSLELDARLIEPAYLHSKDMAVNIYFAHEDVSGCDASCRIKKVGYSFSMLGENLYYIGGFKFDEEELATRIVNGWLLSPHHRENILNPEFTHSAVGVFVVGDKLYATALYSRPR